MLGKRRETGLFQQSKVVRPRGFVLHRVIYLILGIVIIAAVAFYNPKSTFEPGASPEDRAKEDLGRFE